MIFSNIFKFITVDFADADTVYFDVFDIVTIVGCDSESLSFTAFDSNFAGW